MREATFTMPFDIPNSTGAKFQIRCFIASMVDQIGVFGKDGRQVGIGFVWKTRTSIGNDRLFSYVKFVKRVMKTAGMISQMCDPYNLTQRILYIRGGEPSVEIVIKEGQ